jgi:hypothetical protein
MPRRLKSEKRAAEVLAPIPAEILDHFVPDGPLTPADVDAVMRRFKKAFLERAPGAERSHQLGLGPGCAEARRDDESPQWDDRKDRADR